MIIKKLFFLFSQIFNLMLKIEKIYYFSLLQIRLREAISIGEWFKP